MILLQSTADTCTSGEESGSEDMAEISVKCNGKANSVDMPVNVPFFSSIHTSIKCCFFTAEHKDVITIEEEKPALQTVPSAEKTLGVPAWAPSTPHM